MEELGLAELQLLRVDEHQAVLIELRRKHDLERLNPELPVDLLREIPGLWTMRGTTSSSLRRPLVTDSCCTAAFLWCRLFTRTSDVTLRLGYMGFYFAINVEIMENFRYQVSPQRIIKEFGVQVYIES